MVSALLRPLEEAALPVGRRPVYPLLAQGERGVRSEILGGVQLPDLNALDSSRTLELLASALPQLASEGLKDLHFDVADFSTLFESQADDVLDQALINAFGPVGECLYKKQQSGGDCTQDSPWRVNC